MLLHDLEDAIISQPHQSIKEFHQSFAKDKMNGIAFPLKNQGLAISLLYMLLVVPREIWESSHESGTQFPFSTKELFTFQVGSAGDNWQFLRLMRNAISHANFDMNETGNYTFWNINRDGIRNFEVTIHHRDLFSFISEIGKYYLNSKSNEK